MKKLLLVGGGHAMMPTVRHIREHVPDSVQITLLSDHPYLYYSGMVPEFLGGVYTENQVRLDLVSLCERHGIDWVHGRAVRLDPQNKEVYTHDGQVLSGDVIAFDVGSMTPGAQHGSAIVAKPLHYIKALADQLDDMINSDSQHTIAIVGGGAAGVEVALNMSHRFRAAGISDRIKINLFEGNDRVLPTFPNSLSQDGLRALVDAGVKVELSSRPEIIDQNVLKSNLGEHRYDAILWSTGTIGPSFFREAGLQTNERGFVKTDRQMRVLGHKDIFAAGDSALVSGYEHLARIGVHAVKQGPVMVQNLSDAINGKELKKSFAPYPISPIIISTGLPQAWWLAGNIWFKNGLALGMKHHVDRKWINPWLDPAYRSQTLWDYKSASDGKY